MSRLGIVLAILLISAGAAASQKPGNSASTSGEYRSVIDQYCVNCHNADDKVAGLSLDTLDISNVGANPTRGKVLRWFSGMFLPQSAPPPTQCPRQHGPACRRPRSAPLCKTNPAAFASASECGDNAVRDLLRCGECLS
jgi:hypothetical protein